MGARSPTASARCAALRRKPRATQLRQSCSRLCDARVRAPRPAPEQGEVQLCNILIDGISTLTRWENMLENGKAAEVEAEIAAKKA